MSAKFNMTRLEAKYARYLEMAYNLQFSAPAESDFYAHKAHKTLLELLLLDTFTHSRSAGEAA
ncbi:hypothetical protein [Croceiramulus getboli]|nr:hypothetical protein P8624_08100 [Flavobacteriaceae bacterium YJPT1-3]